MPADVASVVGQVGVGGSAPALARAGSGAGGAGAGAGGGGVAEGNRANDGGGSAAFVYPRTTTKSAAAVAAAATSGQGAAASNAQPEAGSDAPALTTDARTTGAPLQAHASFTHLQQVQPVGTEGRSQSPSSWAPQGVGDGHHAGGVVIVGDGSATGTWQIATVDAHGRASGEVVVARTPTAGSLAVAHT